MSKRKLEDEALLLAMDAKNNRNSNTSVPPTHYGNIAQLVAEREIEGPKFRARKVFQTFSSTDESTKKIRLGPINEQIASNHMWVSRLKLKKELDKHTGCVNTVNWNADGTRLITGSDDCKLCIWGTSPSYRLQKCLYTGHHRNIFSGVFVPFTSDREIVSCGMDGEIRWASVEDEKAVLLGSFRHMVYKVFFLPGSGTSFLTTHQDGYVRMFDIREKEKGEKQIVKMKKKGRGNMSANSLAFVPTNPNLFILGGADPYIRLYDMRMIESNKGKPIRRYCPKHVKDSFEKDKDRDFDSFYITGVDMNIYSEIAVTYSREDVYMLNGTDSFASTHIGEKDLVSEFEHRYIGRRNVQTFLKEVAFLGENSYIATGCDSGHLFIWDKKTTELVQLLKADENVVNSLAPHPYLPILASCGIDNTAKVFEVSDTNTFNKEKASKIVAGNTSHEEQEGVSLLHLWELITSLRRRGQMPQMQEEDDDDEEEEEEERDTDNESILDIETSNTVRSQANDYFKEGKYNEAIDLYSEALSYLETPSSNSDIEKKRKTSIQLCLLNIAACALKTGDYDMVIENCDRVLEEQPDNLKALYRRGTAYFHKNKLPKAEADLAKAHELSPQDSTIKELLSEVRAKLKQQQNDLINNIFK